MFKNTNQNVQTFNNSQFGDLRVNLSDDGKIWFCLSDVCVSLGLGNASQTKSRLKQEGITTNDTPTKSGQQQMLFINEPNLYRCIFQSRKQEASAFQDWVFEEILPSIRKTGGYIATKQDDTPEEIMARALVVAQATLARREERLRLLEADNEAKQREIEAAKPAVTFTNAVSGAGNSCLIGELAKIIAQNGYAIGEKRLFKWMRDNGYLGKHGERYNVPNQQYIEQGLFKIKKGVRSGSGGVLHTTITTKVTGKGQIYFVNKFLNTKPSQEG